MGNVSTIVCAKIRCAPLHIKKALGIFRELIPTRRRTTTTRVAFWDPPSESKNLARKSLLLTSRYYTVVSRYYTVHVHDVGNCNMTSAVKYQGNVREFRPNFTLPESGHPG